MTLLGACNFFERLKKETTNTSEIKLYVKFLAILNKLKERTFSKEENELIETELNRLQLNSNPENNKKHIKKALNAFEKYLKDTFSLTTAGYYTKLYGGLGLSFGLLFGVAIFSNLEGSLGISLGLIGGWVVGSIMGRNKEAEAKAAGNIL
ncbi:hypothetical protein [Lacinutrix jangbogonensis]|uniref:hypothetical protein n=1 Tax=Lacinutrix jangbogonensis TaxID=1469557 RepID=UPI00053EDAB7|nr:hypothetical protein [Lacinutrix jangbogonensis]